MPRGLMGCLVLVLLSCWTIIAMAAQSTVVVIINPTVQLDKLTQESARAIFAMRQRTLPDGQSVHVFVLPDGHSTHEQFSKEILGVYPHQLRMAWDRAVFSGTGQAPNEVSNETTMIERVATTPGGIGYISRSRLTDRVRVLTIE